jgi:uncharacterized protein (DUF1697 family)
MKTYIALFRGINVGGNNSLPMADLVDILKTLGAAQIKTYIQSGNAVFQSAEEDTSSLADAITKEVARRRGFAPKVLLLQRADLERAMAENPFPIAELDPSHLHLGFLASPAQHSALEKLNALKKESEQFHLTDAVFYLYAPEGVGRSKLAASSERALGVVMTDRNWRTVGKLQELVAEITADKG